MILMRLQFVKFMLDELVGLTNASFTEDHAKQNISRPPMQQANGSFVQNYIEKLILMQLWIWSPLKPAEKKYLVEVLPHFC